jgi:hypothetical protein
VSLFVLSPEIEDRDEVEVSNWAKHKKTFYLLVRLVKKKPFQSFLYSYTNVRFSIARR